MLAIDSAVIPDVAGDEKRLADDEDDRETKVAEQFEIDPSVSVEIIHYNQVDRSHCDEKQGPSDVQSLPYCRRQDQAARHDALDQGLLADQMASKKRHSKQPVNDRRLPLDERLVVEQQRSASKDNQ